MWLFFLLLGLALWPAAGAMAQGSSAEVDSRDEIDYIGTIPAFSPEALSAATPFGEDAEPVQPGWRVVPEISVKEVFTDNLFLTADDEEQDFVTELTPRINIYGNARRASVRVNYALQGLLYANNGDQNTTFHQLFSAGVGELVRQLVFIDGSATITQQNLTDTGRGVFTNFGPGTFLGGVGDNINVTGERTTVTTYSLSPYLVHRLGDWADAELRFGYDDVSESDRDDREADSVSATDDGEVDRVSATDSTSQRYYAKIESGSRFNELPWSATFDRRDIDYENADPTRFQKLLGSVRFVYSPEISLVGDLGYEDNDFSSAGDQESGISGIIWDVGFRWTPSGRTTLEATYGRRFFGDRYFFNLSHESRRTKWRVSYDERPFTARDTQIEQAVAARGGAIPIIDPVTGLPTVSGAGIPELDDEVFVQRRLSGGLVVEAGRNDFDILVFQEERDFQSSGARDDFWGASVLWTRNISRLTYLDMSVGWTSQDTTNIDPPDERQDDLLGFHVGLRRELGRHLTSTIEYRRVERSSTDPTVDPEEDPDFVENRISAGIRLVF
ncbi:MAG: TIGR03016 family PEP-CTERM system-associated outer membrane protein [Beggiatoa sp.]|nr:TIGR03016 family PEP-CTERM system-associated outer membrane protein [Beggiatoa sp.]